MSDITGVPAGTVAPATLVVTTATHKSIVANLEADLTLAKIFLETAWKTNEVLIIAFIAFVAGFLVKLAF